MDDLVRSIVDRLKAFASGWASVAAFGTFLVYLCGYLSLRFHLTAMGVGAEQYLLDERYLFAGSRFFVYLLSSVPLLAMIGLLAAALGWLLIFPAAKVIKAVLPQGARLGPARGASGIAEQLRRPRVLALIGILLSVILTQLVMRQAFVLGNLLVAEQLPGPDWLQDLLLSENPATRSLYFCGLLAGVVLCGGLFFAALSRGPAMSPTDRILTGALGLMVVIQALFLPINHGILIADKTVALVDARKLGEEALVPAAGPDTDVWTIWEGKETLTLLLRAKGPEGGERRLVTIKRSAVKRLDVLRYDRILGILFRPSSPSPS